MTKPFNPNEALLNLLPDAFQVIEETIHDEPSLDDSDKRKWSAQSLNTSIWLFEKLTGKPRTEDAAIHEGLIKKLLDEIRHNKTVEKESTKQMSVVEVAVVKDALADFVKGFGE